MTEHDYMRVLIEQMREANALATGAVRTAAQDVDNPTHRAMIALSVANACLGLAGEYLALTPAGAPSDMHELLKRTSTEGPGFLLGSAGGHRTN